MAITIIDTPYALTLHGQTLRYVASSDNVGEDGFRYYVTVYDEGYSALLHESYISPDPFDRMNFNLRSIVSMRNYDGDGAGPLHNIAAPYEEVNPNGWRYFTVKIYEAWVISGVLTINEDSVQAHEIRLINGYYQIADGYKPDPNGTNTDTAIFLIGDTYRAFSDRKWNTHKCKYAPAFFLSETPINCFIPVREKDYGILMYPYHSAGGGMYSVRYVIFDSSGAPHIELMPSADVIIDGVGCYPANINDSSMTHKPSVYPDWRYYYVRFVGDIPSRPTMSMTYVFYNAELFGQHDCKHDNVRIAWVNSRGGWDYFNFIKQNEISNSIERKNYKKILAGPNYPYSFSTASPTEITRQVNNTQSLTVNSAPLQENEFVFLRSLMLSSQVHWVHDDGTHTPVILTTDNYKEIRDRKPKLKSLELTFKVAQEYWT